MELVSSSNLVSSESEKKKKQQPVIFNSYEVRGQIGSYAYTKEWFHDSRNVKKHPKKHIYTKQQNQNQPARS